MVLKTPLMTVEAFWEQYGGKPFELVHGKVVEVSPSGSRASAIAGRIIGKIEAYLDKNPIGIVTIADGGYVLDGYNLRVPDVAYMSNEKWDSLPDPDKYAPFSPDIAIEVVSPTDGASEVQEKVGLYLESGVLLVWVVYPNRKEVIVYQPDGTSRTYTANDTLDAGKILPGFVLPVANIFARLTR
jgi:Uma2 family endonuclease